MRLFPRFLLAAVVLVVAALAANQARAIDTTPVLVYHEVQADGSLILFRRTGEAAPEKLVTVTEVAHLPAYRLSYSQKLLALNFGDSIQLLDLSTKKLKTLLTTTGTFDSLDPPTAGVAISTDDRYVLAIERTLGVNEDPPGGDRDRDEVTGTTIAPSKPQRYTYRIHYVNVTTGKDKVLRRATVQQVNVPRFFRTDGLALFLTPAGKLTLFDVRKKKFIKPAQTRNTRLFSGDGIAMPVEGESRTGVCGKPRAYSIIDYRTGRSYGFVKTEHNYLRLIAISPDKDAVLFSSTAVADASGKCVYGSARYFVANLDTGAVTETADYLAVMREYDAWYIGAREGRTSVAGELRYAINVNGVSVVTSALPLTVAAQFWE